MKKSLIDKLVQQAEKDKIEKIVAGGIIIRDGKVLILQRASTEDFLPNIKELPSGGLKKGEGILEGLVREVAEETDLQITEVICYSGHFDYISGSGKKTRQFNFVVKTTDNQVKLNPKEHNAYFWIPFTNEIMVNEASDKTQKALLEAEVAAKV